MIVPLDCLNYHIIGVYLQFLPYREGKNRIHEAMVVGANVLEVKRHDILAVVVIVRHEGCFRCVQGIHLNLVVPLIYVHEAQHEVS